jgi:hypothetical protein
MTDNVELDRHGRNKANGQFVKGHTTPAANHRPHGRPNKITRDLREGIIDAAVAHGFDGKGRDGLVGYLRFLAARYPKPFASLLGRLLPLQVSGNIGSFIGAVQIVSAPAGSFLSAEDITKLSPPRTINSEPADVTPLDEASFDDVTQRQPYQAKE